MRDIPIPKRIAALPRAENGYPIPFFVPITKGVPDFRVADEGKRLHCLKHCVCWICGQPQEKMVAFAGGPMSLRQRHFSDAPMHLECAEFSMKVCPHILNNKMQRKDLGELPALAGMRADDRVEYFGLHISRRGCWAIFRQGEYWCWSPEKARQVTWWDGGVQVPDPWAATGGWEQEAERLLEERLGLQRRQDILKAYARKN